MGGLRIYKLPQYRLALLEPNRVYYFEIGACTVLAIAPLIELVGVYIIDHQFPAFKIVADLCTSAGWVRLQEYIFRFFPLVGIKFLIQFIFTHKHRHCALQFVC